MKMSYKIALIAAVALFAIAIILFTGPSDTGEPSTDTTTTAEQTQPEIQPRKTLMSEPAKDSTPAPLAEKSPASQPVAGTPGNSLTSDVRDRIRAAAAQDNNQPAPTTTTDTPVSATALTNTGTGSSGAATQPQTKPAAPVSQNSLDAILGTSANTSTPPANTPATTPPTTTAAAPATKPTATGDTVYTVQPGDTFSSIASKHYNDESKWFDIAQSNPTVDPTRLRVGQELRLPAIQFLAKHEEPIPAGPTGIRTYTIRPGDSLSTVAEVSYGDPTLWRVIYNFNRDKIGDNPNAIQAGMTLRVPPRVQGAN
jgi:nucleoid-associated protein YgaU